MRFVLVGRGYFHFGFQYRHKVAGKADANKNRPERFLRRECANDQFSKLEFVELCLVAPREKLLHRFPQIGFRFFERAVSGVFARKAAQVRAVRIAINLGQEQPAVIRVRGLSVCCTAMIPSSTDP